MLTPYQRHLAEVKSQLDSVSPTFCIAKWKQVTMHLQNGQTHSCHHPKTHHIPIHEIKVNPTALHNTNYKKEQRKLMLEGKRPPECDYCWRVEDSPGNNYSDRVYKSSDRWAAQHLESIRNKPWDDDVAPSYVEISFGNVCNFKCSYCAPHISSSWMEEIERYGPYPTSGNFNNLEWIRNNNMMPIPNKDDNPYVDAFWQWWPQMYTQLSNFRITGGEPLLNKNTFKILDYIIENPNPQLELGINTNLNPPPEIFDRFLELIKIIVERGYVKRLKLFTSAEAHGRQAEYIRWGMNYDVWLQNIHRTFSCVPDIQFTIMSTYNLLSIPSYELFLSDILDAKKRWGKNTDTFDTLLLDIPYLNYPQHQSPLLLDSPMLDNINSQIRYMQHNLELRMDGKIVRSGFHQREIDKLIRIRDMAVDALENPQPDLFKHRADFVAFVDEHDFRRGSDFLETFPQLSDAYFRWRQYGE